MKTLLTIAAMLAAGNAHPAPLSPAAKQAINDWHLCRAPELPAGFIGQGTRRFSTGVLTWNAQPSMLAAARETMALIQSYMIDPITKKPLLTLREVPYTDAAAQLKFHTGSSLVVPGLGSVPLPGGCGPAPTMGPDHLTYLSAEIVCKTADGSGLSLLMHETWWHLFFSFCHTKEGLGSPSFVTAAPDWEGVPGHREALRWIYTVPAGSFPP